jgi:hypothetical protein
MKASTSLTSSVSSSVASSKSSSKPDSYALRVFLRVRPPLPKEPADEGTLIIGPPTSSDGVQTVSVAQHDAKTGEERRGRHGQMAFTFDAVFGPRTSQAEVFARAVRAHLQC